MPPGERDAHSPGSAATILPTGSGTPMTPVEETRSESFGRPSARHAASEVAFTAPSPSALHALALPLLTTMPRRAPRDFSRFPHATGAANTRFLVKTTSETHGTSLTTRARSGLPVFLMPQAAPAPRKPRTRISFTGRTASRPRAAALLVLLPRAARARVV